MMEMKDFFTEEEIKDLKDYEKEYILSTLETLYEMEASNKRVENFIETIKSCYCFNPKRRFMGLRWASNEATDPRIKY